MPGTILRNGDREKEKSTFKMLRDYLERDKSDKRKREGNPGCREIKHLQYMSSARTKLSKYILILKKKKEKKKISLH